MMGGTVHVQSELGVGSTFGLTLPVWAPQLVELSPPSAEAQAA